MAKKNVEQIELIVNPKQAKPAVYYFCNCVKYEMDKQHTNNIREALTSMARQLCRFSAAHPEKLGIQSVEYDSVIFEPFVNKRSRIPWHVWEWLYRYYNGVVDFEGSCNSKPLDMYYKIKQDFIEHHKFCKEGDKFDASYEKERRHKLRRVARDGKYNYTIYLRDKDFDDIFTNEEYDEAEVLLSSLFYKQIYKCHDSIEAAAAAFLLGVKQGMHTERTRSNSETITNLDLRLSPEYSGKR